METNGSGRLRWDDSGRRKKKEPTLYDEWLSQEKQEQQTTYSPRRASVPPRLGDTTAPGGHSDSSASVATIRAVTPDTRDSEVTDDGAVLPDRGTTSFERAFIPYTTTTIVGGPASAAGTPTGSSGSSKARKLVKEREWAREARMTSHSPPSSRNGSSVVGMLARNSSKSNGHRAPAVMSSEKDSYGSVRARTRTLDERRRDVSPPSLNTKIRNRLGSGTMPASPSSGAEYLASVPASTSPPSAPSIGSVGSAAQAPLDIAGRRSISPTSSGTADSVTSTLPSSGARRILHLMRTLNGRMGGNVLLRRDVESTWSQIYCYIQEETGSLMYEPRGGDGAPRKLVSALAGCGVRPNIDGDTPYLEVSIPQSDMELHLKLLTQADFDSWYAALLYWQSLGPRASPSTDPRPPSAAASGTPARPEPPPRTSSSRQQRDRAGSAKSDRRRSVGHTLKEAPVIKIGNMIFWDTNIGYSNSPDTPSAIGQPATARPQAYRMQSYASRRWRNISGQLRENGELKLHADADNSLISVVQLSQLSRCAIQRLDPSVLDNEFCIAIYPQYTSTTSNNQPTLIRPIFLSLENRVLYEVWFVLLRAFTIPQLYGPRNMAENEGIIGTGSTQDIENMLTTSTTDMFRMERSFDIRIIEAKMMAPQMNTATAEPGFHDGHRRAHTASVKPDQHGYYAEVLLDTETRGRTSVKFEGNTPLWGESFQFLDLPPVLTSASVVIKRRPPDNAQVREESKLVHEAYGFKNDQHGGYSGLTFNVTCGKVEIYLNELDDKELEKWWPVVNMYNQPVGEVLIKARAEEGVILMARDYQPLSDLLHRFSNGLTLQIAQMVPGELKRVSDCLLNIYQVSGRAGDWLMALVEEEIDGIHKETPISRLRYSRRVGSDASHDNLGSGSATADRELIVRDMNKNATLEANLLFRGNTLLTKSLDTQMRRVGKEYLEEALGNKLKEINEKDPDCEVDPNRVSSQQELDRNWRRLLLFTQEVWKSIVASKDKCPVELRVIFRHIRACAEDRYGDFLRSVSYSSVSGFLFLRFFCPAVLNPRLFGLLKEDVKPRARRAFTLIAKSLQTLSNMASFGTKETWMEPMNTFLTQHRESFKSFIDDMCYVPTPLSSAVQATAGSVSPTYAPGVVSAETHLSYTTPMTIMQRLPPTSREGFPSLPYLIDQARAFAELIQLWLEATSQMAGPAETANHQRSHAEVMAAIKASEGDLMAFHEVCTSLHKRTQECLNRAERAERPHSTQSFNWDGLIGQLPSSTLVATDSDSEVPPDMPPRPSFDTLADKIASDPSIAPPATQPIPREWDIEPDEDDDDDDEHRTMLYDITPQSASRTTFDFAPPSRDRPSSMGLVNNIRESVRKAQNQSRGSNSPAPSASASVSHDSSNVSSDTEHNTGTTALPSYNREIRHRQRREAAKQQIKQEVEAARIRSMEKEKRKVKTPIVSALRKKKERERSSNNGPSVTEGYASHG